MREELQAIVTRMNAIEARLAAVETRLDSGGEPSEQADDIPEFVQPTGVHDAYNTGDRVRYHGTVYECRMDGCVWSPEVYPAAWEEIEEEETDQE